MANPSDTKFYLIAETVPGTTPATPAFQEIAHIPGSTPMEEADFVDSPVLKPNRAAGLGRKTNFRVGGGVQTQLKRDTAHDVLLQSALSGTFTTNVLKGGTTDSSFTVERRMLEGATTLYKRFAGCQVTSFKLSADPSGIAEATFDVVGMTATTGTAILTGATYAVAANTTPLTGIDVTSVTIAGLTAKYLSFELTVDSGREALQSFGSTGAFAVAQGSPRSIKLNMTFFRSDHTPETLFRSDNPFAVSITIGAGANGYMITLPACVSTLPQDEEDGAKAIVSVELTPGYDATEQTDIKITKLT